MQEFEDFALGGRRWAARPGSEGVDAEGFIQKHVTANCPGHLGKGTQSNDRSFRLVLTLIQHSTTSRFGTTMTRKEARHNLLGDSKKRGQQQASMEGQTLPLVEIRTHLKDV